MRKLSHVNARGEASMVDVSAKPVMLRAALARGEIRLAKATLELIGRQAIAKGNVLATARLAGILAAKKTGELIPLCHPLPITHCEVKFETPKSGDRIVIMGARVKISSHVSVRTVANKVPPLNKSLLPPVPLSAPARAAPCLVSRSMNPSRISLQSVIDSKRRLPRCMHLKIFRLKSRAT